MVETRIEYLILVLNVNLSCHRNCLILFKLANEWIWGLRPLIAFEIKYITLEIIVFNFKSNFEKKLTLFISLEYRYSNLLIPCFDLIPGSDIG
ncbi:hypothetical protein BpHYR1_044665 [Brachionus plicatilis]|uniref:Uncharacterized protein n=1 Tax=Brachionus plicatilis TaxID=10195 RepID=A0A3M7PD34_BRAPC|nr:hypothetical protein BpHYR1_044665 [Brachionus plicatilis]